MPTSERGGVRSQIDDDIPDFACDTSHHFRLPDTALKVQTSKSISDGSGMIILQPLRTDPCRSELSRMITLKEKPSRVFKNTRLNQPDTL